jgi:VIT1/CCC1 family predicted Fe2+/Mn2+ transporter
VSIGRALAASVILTGLALVGFGAVKARYAGASPRRSAMQTLAVGGIAAGVAFGIGRAVASLAG